MTKHKRSTRSVEKSDGPERMVLIVDDLSDWHQVLEGLVNDIGYSCYSASTYEEAIRVLSVYPIRLAILDIRLSDVNAADTGGLEILEYIIAQGLRTRVIMFSGYYTAASVRDAFVAGGATMVDFVDKCDPGRLCELICRALES